MSHLKFLSTCWATPTTILICTFAAVLFLTSLDQQCLAQFGQTVQTAKAEEGSFRPDQFTDARFKQYEKQLNAILKTRRDEEKAFVAEIVAQVRLGKIPAQIVQTSFHWVHKKRPYTNFPFIYFEKVLRLQATKIGIGANVPEFDFSIYRAINNSSTNTTTQR